MAANYTDLKSEIADWLERSGDSVITNKVDTFIDFAEAEFNRILRVDDMITTGSIATVANTETVARPSDYQQTVSLYNTTDPQSIEYGSIKNIRDRYPSVSAGFPRYVAEYPGDLFLLGPTPDAVYTLNLVYFQTIPALGGAQATNWLLDANPDLYLYRSLWHARGFMQDPQGAAEWGEISKEVIKTLQAADDRDRVSGSSLQQRPQGRKP